VKGEPVETVSAYARLLVYLSMVGLMPERAIRGRSQTATSLTNEKEPMVGAECGMYKMLLAIAF
jgi:hypothetical protein